jgi:chromosome segregation ATPase
MRSTSPATIFAALLLLAGCATSPDPAQGGFISGVNGLLSGGYKQRVAEQSTDLEQMRMQQAAAEAQSNQARAALSERERQVAKLRGDVSRLDRSLKDAQAKAARQRIQNVALSDRDRQLMSDLESDKARLAILQRQLSSNMAADDYDAARQEYLNLEASIEALIEQLKGDGRL